ncbi:hypothetical protein TNCV_666581 [Trichonephila clavipes]|uniref:Uncharacterized protein n=1 Tax=Trichonephila clavipes TaxID=2585209 RepID=A0A8X6SJ07_TRICX|nr:hypothetical protein TNCV_666581 [Trichonephila clavipes]
MAAVVCKVTDSRSACHEFEPSTAEDRVGERCPLNQSRAQTSYRWWGVEVRRGGCQLRCRPRHLTMAQNYEFRRQAPSSI